MHIVLHSHVFFSLLSLRFCGSDRKTLTPSQRARKSDFTGTSLCGCHRHSTRTPSQHSPMRLARSCGLLAFPLLRYFRKVKIAHVLGGQRAGETALPKLPYVPA